MFKLDFLHKYGFMCLYLSHLFSLTKINSKSWILKEEHFYEI
jgi:hypothetical protein